MNVDYSPVLYNPCSYNMANNLKLECMLQKTKSLKLIFGQFRIFIKEAPGTLFQKIVMISFQERSG